MSIEQSVPNDIPTTKEELIIKIKSWLEIDEKMRAHQREIKRLRSEKKSAENILMSTMKSNDIDCFDINGGKLVYTQTNVRVPLSKKILKSALEEFFKDDKGTIVQDLGLFIMDSRGSTVKEGIKRKGN